MGEMRRPACEGSWSSERKGPHEPHGYWKGRYEAWLDCPGWTQQEDDATALSMRLNQVARDAWRQPPPGPDLPPGIRLECHPLVPAVLEQLFIPSYGEFVTSLADARLGGPGIAHWVQPRIPVLVVQGMTRGQWRLTTDDGLVAEGTVRDG